MATPEADVLAAAEAAASPPGGAAEALSEAAAAAVAPASEAAAELGCICCIAPGAALMLSMRVSTSLTAICRGPSNRVGTT